jgi:hypothetical protein
MLANQLNQVQVAGLVGLSVIYWGAAALAIRYGGHIIYINNLRRISTYLASVPIVYVAMLFSEGLLGIDSRQRLTSTAIMSASALMLDGVAYMWFPSLYENPSLKKKNPHLAIAFSRMGAAWLLWGVGASFVVALLTH